VTIEKEMRKTEIRIAAPKMMVGDPENLAGEPIHEKRYQEKRLMGRSRETEPTANLMKTVTGLTEANRRSPQ
jgi:NAD dependent epimerase/dehydratase family enzyme